LSPGLNWVAGLPDFPFTKFGFPILFAILIIF
jgi:hypothetical protein